MRKQTLFCMICFCLPLFVMSQGFPSGGGSGGLFGSTSSNPSDSTKTKFFTIFKGNPGRAALYSLVLPGAGQLYNKRWWKVPLVYGMEGFAIYNYIKGRETYNKWNGCYLSFIDPFPEGVCNNVTQINDAYDIRNRARSQKERAFLIMIGAHLFQSLEAFIDRHLIDFDVDENLSHQQSINYNPNSLETQIPVFSLKIPLSRRTAK